MHSRSIMQGTEVPGNPRAPACVCLWMTVRGKHVVGLRREAARTSAGQGGLWCDAMEEPTSLARDQY